MSEPTNNGGWQDVSNSAGPNTAGSSTPPPRLHATLAVLHSSHARGLSGYEFGFRSIR